ncbi:O-antigen ligase family protein [Hymenobacter sp.]|uniref:O-antigen ligase family protein n=1 Tax=Hymenobacter sp. TaxID=1898978 RepID=UPI00286CB723|nr:O-antigen ligase family protein [Hymenobacter sp.]
MKISFRPLKLVLPLLLVFFLDQAFWEFFFDVDNASVLKPYEWGVLGAGVGAALWYGRRLEPAVGRGLLLTGAALLGLLLESYATHGTWLVYMHVFSKVLVLFLIYGICGCYRQQGLPPLGLLVGVLFGALLLNLAAVHPEALSLRAFLDHERGFAASSALLLVLPALLCLNWYLERGRLLALGVFFVALGLIVFLQHRSVWLAMLVGLLVNLGVVARRVPSARLSLHRVALLVLLPVAVGAVGGLATVLGNPDVIKKFETSINDIVKPDKRGTGNWRLRQQEAYRPLVAERPLLGWRLKGFEVPMQFYDPTSDQPMWADGTGHHFHSFYMDRLFYFGWAGLLLVVVLPIAQIIRRLGHPAPLTAEAAALVGLFSGCLVYGLSYDWPIYLYALVGLLLAAITRPAPPAEAPLVVPRPEPESEPVFAN